MTEYVVMPGSHYQEICNALREKTGERIDTLGVAGEFIRMTLPVQAREGDILRGPVRNHTQS